MNDGQSQAESTILMLWKLLFFSIVVGYCLYYAPYGVNETDGGFLTGLAWQVLSGKVLYLDIVYVRPPLPVWLRALELLFLPEKMAILGERWFFYGKLALYSWAGAVVVLGGRGSSSSSSSGRSGSVRGWILAVLGFVVSAHCYPPMAWHTVDGILFATLSVYFLQKKASKYQILAGFFLFCAVLCKQSFYPLIPLFALLLWLEKEFSWKRARWFFGAFGASIAFFCIYLYQNGSLSGFLQMTAGAAGSSQALQHGLLDYFRITPELALPSILLLFPVVWWYWKGQNHWIALTAWRLWLFSLVASYAAITWLRQDHTAPFAQARAMFWVAVVLFSLRYWKQVLPSGIKQSSIPSSATFPLLLLGISWCASVSWGYNLPILFATPWVWAGMEVTNSLVGDSKPIRFSKLYTYGLLVALLISFRIGHEFVYRDGHRSNLNKPMGAVFPALTGIYSNSETLDLYMDLNQLIKRYGPNFKTLPAFPQANFLNHTPPPLPLDWVVNRETNGDNSLIYKNLLEKKPLLFIQKSFSKQLETDPELAVTRQILATGIRLEETPHFWVVSLQPQALEK